jgi:transcriptional regulator with XRE-family HTH domain
VNIKIGEKIKFLRKKTNITQDKLAEYLGITPQAVSRWESETAYPDIETLPAIANFFNVTSDELLGIDRTQNQQKTEKIYEELSEYNAKGLHDKSIEVLRTAIQEFPNNYGFLHSLSSALSDKEFYIQDGGEKKKLQDEIIAILERIAADCPDDDMKYGVLQSLALAYNRAGNPEKAIETAKKLPGIHCTRDIVLANILTGEEKIRQLKFNITEFSDMLSRDYSLLARDKYIGAEYSEEKIMLYGKAVKVFEVLCENGDYGFYHNRLCSFYYALFQIYFEQKNIESAVYNLEKAAYHSIEYDKPEAAEKNEFFEHTSIVFEREPGDGSKMTYTRSANHNSSYGLLNLLEEPKFDALREIPEFKKICGNLKNYAKNYE